MTASVARTEKPPPPPSLTYARCVPSTSVGRPYQLLLVAAPRIAMRTPVPFFPSGPHTTRDTTQSIDNTARGSREFYECPARRSNSKPKPLFVFHHIPDLLCNPRFIQNLGCRDTHVSVHMYIPAMHARVRTCICLYRLISPPPRIRNGLSPLFAVSFQVLTRPFPTSRLPGQASFL